MGDPYERESLAVAIAASTGWADLIRRLGLQVSGGRRRALQLAAERHGIDTRHFARHDSRRTYSDEAIASAAASSFTVREVALELGARPSTGTLSHLVRRIAAAGIDISHFRGLRRERVELPFTTQELTVAAASSDSIRATGRALGMPDDGRARAALARALKAHSIDTTHFRNSRLAIAEADLRAVVPHATSHADVMRALGIEVNDVNHRRVRRRIAQLDVDVSHFTRRPWSRTPAAAVKDMAADTLVLSPAGSPPDQALPTTPRLAGNRGSVRMYQLWQPRRMAGPADHASDRPRERRLARQPVRKPAIPLPQLPRPDRHVVPEAPSQG